MTKKHYIQIARIIKSYTNNNVKKIPVKTLVYDLNKYFKQDNPNFDEKRFSEACK
tara:strand:+ start:102 stop:266 length:165 start_codon:yes stop_codon:yes gene_type:complete